MDNYTCFAFGLGLGVLGGWASMFLSWKRHHENIVNYLMEQKNGRTKRQEHSSI